MSTFKCRACLEDRPTVTKAKGRGNVCRPCYNAQIREYRADNESFKKAHRDYMREYMRAYRAAKRAAKKEEEENNE